METFNTRRLERAILFISLMVGLLLPFVHNWKKTYEQDGEILERWFMDLHPDVNNIQWPQLENLLQKTHRKICDEVFRSVQPYFDDYIFVEEYPSNPDEKSKRVRGPELLEMKKEMLAIPIVECYYNRNGSILTSPPSIVYLTHANSSHVFTLSKDKYSDIFYLQTGLHPVPWN